jgi:hypothetical protein
MSPPTTSKRLEMLKNIKKLSVAIKIDPTNSIIPPRNPRNVVNEMMNQTRQEKKS